MQVCTVQHLLVLLLQKIPAILGHEKAILGCSDRKIKSGVQKSSIIIDFDQGPMDYMYVLKGEKLQRDVTVHIIIQYDTI